jgi:hypothetical protein
MTKNFPSNNFICVSNFITKKYDIFAGIIFGYIWSKSQLKNGFCNVSYKNIADDLGISKKTIERKIAILIEADLIQDVSETRFNKPGVTRKYICNDLVLRKLDSSDFKTLVKNSSVSLSIGSDFESQGSDSLSQSSDFQSKSSDLKSVKIYREVYKEEDKEIYKENIDDSFSSSDDTLKQTKLEATEKINNILNKNQKRDLDDFLIFQKGISINLHELEKYDLAVYPSLLEAINQYMMDHPEPVKEEENDFPF